MKRIIITILLITIGAYYAPAQISVKSLLGYPQVMTGSFQFPTNDSNYLKLQMDFASPEIINKEDAKKLSGKLVYKVLLVYTSFRFSETFEQPELNEKRLEELKKIAPKLFGNRITEWGFVAQGNCKTEECARKMYHGFVVYYAERKEMTPIAETKLLDETVASDSLGTVTKEVVTRKKILRKRICTDLYEPLSAKKRKEGVLYKNKMWFRKKHCYTQKDTVLKTDSVAKFYPSPYVSTITMRFGPDSTVLSVLNRNKKWEKMLVVCDVTGSMAPYSGQVLVWHKLHFNEGKTLGYSFFNDGDNKADNAKEIGKTGGIHLVDGDELLPVENMARHAMSQGSGGDGPENNIEALLKAIEKYPDSKEIIMVADNWAPIKDIKLAAQIKKPIRIILCGVWNNMINTDYLDLARMTKGSLHTIESDLNNLMEVNEGQNITISGITYTVQKGRFVATKKM